MTDDTQELDGIMDEIYDLAYDHLPEKGITAGTDKIKQAILDWHNKQVKNAVAAAEDNLDQYWNKELDKQIEEVLDRIENSPNGAYSGTQAHMMINDAIRDERNRLKEGRND